MAAPITSPLRTILAAIQAQIVAKTSLTSNRILLVVDKRVPHFQGDQDCLVHPGPIEAVEAYSTSVGSFAFIVQRSIVITLRTRFGVDLSDRSDSWIQDATFGHYTTEELLCAALDSPFQPVDAAGNALTQEPLHFIKATDPVNDTDDPTWGSSTLTFTILYQLAAVQTF